MQKKCIIIIKKCIIIIIRAFHISASWWSSTGFLSDSKSPQVSRTLLSILAVIIIIIIIIKSALLLLNGNSCLKPYDCVGIIRTR